MTKEDQERAQQVINRLTGTVPCPTPDCPGEWHLDAVAFPPLAKCKQCGVIVVVGKSGKVTKLE